MWSWLQKLMSFFRGEDEQVETDEVRPSGSSNPRQLQAKTKSIYPRERETDRTNDEFSLNQQRYFRFPVVPDHYPERKNSEREIREETNKVQAYIPPQNERKSKRRDELTDFQERAQVPKEKSNVHTQLPKQPEIPRTANKRQAEKPTTPPVPNPSRLAGVEKRTYQPSDIVSPVYGKITPATKEEEHRIHTTAGIVYPRQEQEENLKQLKRWDQLKKEEAQSKDGAVERSDGTEEQAKNEEPLFLFTREQQPAFADEMSDLQPAESSLQTASTVPVEDLYEAELHTNEVAVTIETVLVDEPAGTITHTDQREVDGADDVQSFESEWKEEELAWHSDESQNISDMTHEEQVDDATAHDYPWQASASQTEEPATNVESIEADEELEESAPAIMEEIKLTQVQEDDSLSLDEDESDDEQPVMESVHEDASPTSVVVQPWRSPELTRLLERAEAKETELNLSAQEPEHSDTPASESSATVEPTEQVEELEEPTYQLPALELLNPSPEPTGDDDEHTQLQKLLLEETLANFNVSAQVVGIVKGPSVTRFELQPAPGVKVNKITGLIDDIKLNLAAKDIRIEAPIPGRNAIGIEVPNLSSQPVLIEKIIGSEKFQQHSSPLAVALGMDIGGEPIIADIKKMPHGLIAGSTGSGKSVCINSIIVSLLYKATPEQVRLLLIDPKMVELAPYNNLPHLVTPVVTEAKQATAALKWAVEEMEKRYALFVDAGVRDIDRYNQTTDDVLPFIVIVIDELADLMMVSPQDVEDCIIRIAQKARACGIHLLLATQRPSVDVITGNIKANVPTRLAFAVFSQVDSRTILDQSGAERLLGRGDMLFLESGTTPVRLQGNFVSDDEIERITHVIKKQRKPSFLFSKEDLEHQVQSYDAGDDPLYLEALMYVAEQGQASASGLQRRFRVGYNRAARLIEMMEADGYVAGQSGGKARAVLISLEDAQAVVDGSTLV